MPTCSHSRLLEAAPHIERLRVKTGCRHAEGAAHQWSVASSALARCARLRELVITCKWSVNSLQAVQAAVSQLQHLRTLQLNTNSTTRNDATCSAIATLLIGIAEACSTLQRLREVMLANYSGASKILQFDDVSELLRLFQKGPNFQSLGSKFLGRHSEQEKAQLQDMCRPEVHLYCLMLKSSCISASLQEGGEQCGIEVENKHCCNNQSTQQHDHLCRDSLPQSPRVIVCADYIARFYGTKHASYTTGSLPAALARRKPSSTITCSLCWSWLRCWPAF